MTVITMSPGESLADLLKRSGNLISFNSGIWLLEKGSLQKRALKSDGSSEPNILDNYSIVNIYAQGDYFQGDSDMEIDYFALEESVISLVTIPEIDPVRLLFQLDSLEELMHQRSYSDREDKKKNKLPNFFAWACKKLNRSDEQIVALLSQEEIGKLMGLRRSTVNRKLAGMPNSDRLMKMKRSKIANDSQ